MTSITDPNVSVRFTTAMEEIHNKQLKTFGEVMDTTTELCQFHKQFVKITLDACLKKTKDDEMMFETMQTFKRDAEHKNASLKEKQHAISELLSEIQQKESQKDDIIQDIERLKEDQTKKKELIKSQNKANKDRMKNLKKARVLFEEHLGLEIRTILTKTNDKKLQFIFRNIDLSDLDSPYVITMGIDGGTYQIVSSDPPLECLSVMESRLQETNNLAAFLANMRKEFIALARR